MMDGISGEKLFLKYQILKTIIVCVCACVCVCKHLYVEYVIGGRGYSWVGGWSVRH